MQETSLTVYGVSKQFGGIHVLNHVSLEAKSGEALGLVGVNGAGKTTLMNIIAGETSLEQGEIRIGRLPARIGSPSDAERLGIALIHQEPVDFSRMTVAENIFISRLQTFRWSPFLRHRQMESEVTELLERIGSKLGPKTRISELSMGARQQVAVARALAQKSKIVLFDEPTASLTTKEKNHLFELINILKQQGVVIVYITHFIDEVIQVCDRVCVLRDGGVVSIGPIRDYSVKSIIREMLGRDLESFQPGQSGVPAPSRTDVLLDVQSLSVGTKLKSVSLSLARGEVLGLWGLMGSGRTELVRAILGLDAMTSGAVRYRRGERLEPVSGGELLQECGYITENRHDDGLFLSEPVWWNISSANMRSFAKGLLSRMDTRREKKAALGTTEELKVRMPSITSPVGKLSGGNQQKVIVGKWLQRHPLLYFMDEPTRGVDVGSKAEIQRIIRTLAEQGAGILLISSEVEEIVSLSDRVLVLRGGGVVGEFSHSNLTKENLLAQSIGSRNNA